MAQCGKTTGCYKPPAEVAYNTHMHASHSPRKHPKQAPTPRSVHTTASSTHVAPAAARGGDARGSGAGAGR